MLIDSKKISAIFPLSNLTDIVSSLTTLSLLSNCDRNLMDSQFFLIFLLKLLSLSCIQCAEQKSRFKSVKCVNYDPDVINITGCRIKVFSRDSSAFMLNYTYIKEVSRQIFVCIVSYYI